MPALLLLCLALLPDALLPRLGDRAFRRRESATRALAALGRPALPALERGLSHPDAEVRRRCGLLLAPYRGELADRDSRTFGRLPWLSDACGLDGEYVSHALARARPAVGKPGAPDWPEYREATRLYVRSLLLRRTPRAEILERLGELAAEEARWKAEHRRGE